MVAHRTTAMQLLRDRGFRGSAGDDLAIVAAGANGSITVWIEDAKLFRCVFHRFQAELDSSAFATIVEVDAWLKQWWPQLGPRLVAVQGVLRREPRC
jgi:hypothetical protein